MKEILLNRTITEMEEFVNIIGEKTYRAKQILKSLYMGLDFCDMTDLSLVLREKLTEIAIAQPVKIEKVFTSKDGTEKYLFSLIDDNLIEGVLMKYKYGHTLCISTQAGCRMNCVFCASGLSGLVRNLTPAEMLGEIIAVNKKLGGGIGDKRKIINVVLMGSGEPFDNYDNVVKFLRLVSDREGICISPRNISLSTCGIVPKMIQFIDEQIPINLTVSLHSPFDEERQKIMPIAKTYTIAEIIDACEKYFVKTGRRYIFEYVLIKGENDTQRHANELINLLKGKPCHINLIRLNEVKERKLSAGTVKSAYDFLNILIKGGLSATVRRKMGEDIEGACGQLRRRYIKENE